MSTLGSSLRTIFVFCNECMQNENLIASVTAYDSLRVGIGVGQFVLLEALFREDFSNVIKVFNIV